LEIDTPGVIELTEADDPAGKIVQAVLKPKAVEPPAPEEFATEQADLQSWIGFAGSPVLPDGEVQEAAALQATESGDAGIPSGNNLGAGGAGYAAARTGFGGSSPGAVSTSARAYPAAALANGGGIGGTPVAQSTSRQGLANAPVAELSASASRVNPAGAVNHVPTPGNMTFTSQTPQVFTTGVPSPTTPNEAAGQASDVIPFLFADSEWTLPESLFPANSGAGAGGPMSLDSDPVVETPRLNPEPTSLLLLGTGLGLLARRLKRRERVVA
jgi:hypothetical protein